MARRKSDSPQKAAMREMMQGYLKENDISIKSGNDVNSIMRDMIVIAYGDVEPLDQKNPSVLAYRRVYEGEEIYVVSNFYGNEVTWKCEKDLSEFEVLLSNYKDKKIEENKLTLRPYESIILYNKIK